MKRLILIVIFFLCYTVHTKAQVAVLNSQKVIASVKEFAKIDTLVAKETSGYANEYSNKKLALNKLVSIADSLYKLDAKGTITTKAISEAQTADKDLKAYSEMANKKIADYKQLLTKPYTDKVMAAIKLVAIRSKYMQVLDNATVNVLYLNPVTDITEQVIKELKLK